jgi:hypothetical protein
VERRPLTHALQTDSDVSISARISSDRSIHSGKPSVGPVYFEILMEPTAFPFHSERTLASTLKNSRSTIWDSSQKGPLTLIHMNNASVHTASVAQDKWYVSRFKCMPYPPYNPDIVRNSAGNSARRMRADFDGLGRSGSPSWRGEW